MSDEQTDSFPRPLNYAPPVQRRWIKGWALALGLFTIVCGTGLTMVALFWMKTSVNTARVVNAPPVAIPKLIPSGIPATPTTSRYSGGECETFDRRWPTLIYSTNVPIYAPDPQCWETLTRRVIFTGQEDRVRKSETELEPSYLVKPGTLCFGHRLDTKSISRLVSLRCGELSKRQPVLMPFLVVPGQTRTTGTVDQLAIGLDPDDECQVYSATLDQSDPSRFTFLVMVNDKPCKVIGQLLDTDRLTLTPEGGRFNRDFIVPIWIPVGSHWTPPPAGSSDPFPGVPVPTIRPPGQ